MSVLFPFFKIPRMLARIRPETLPALSAVSDFRPSYSSWDKRTLTSLIFVFIIMLTRAVFRAPAAGRLLQPQGQKSVGSRVTLTCSRYARDPILPQKVAGYGP